MQHHVTKVAATCFNIPRRLHKIRHHFSQEIPVQLVLTITQFIPHNAQRDAV
jgi:hypothetical protein